MPYEITAGLIAVSAGAHQALAVNAWLNTASGEMRFFVPGASPSQMGGMVDAAGKPLGGWQDAGLCAVIQVAGMVEPGPAQDGLDEVPYPRLGD